MIGNAWPPCWRSCHPRVSLWQEVMIGADRFAIPEVLFNPALLAAHYPAAADALRVRGGTS